MTPAPKNIPALMGELSEALADLAQKMSNLAMLLENDFLESGSNEALATMKAAIDTIEKARKPSETD